MRISNLWRRDLVTVAALALVGLAVRYAWWTTLPLSAGDWHWLDRSRMVSRFPWPGVWDPTLGFMGSDRFLDAFRSPTQAVTGLIAWLGGDWTLAEKLVYFAPYAILLPVGGWLLSREVIGRSRWALLTPLMLLGNPYFILEANGHVPLTLAEAIVCFAAVTFIRAMRRLSIGWALITGLLLGVVAVFDVRPAYLGALFLILYFVVRTLSDPSLRRTGIQAFLGLLVGLAFLITQMFWVLPLVTYHGNPGFPTPQTPDFSIITLGHGLAGLSPYWTGDQPARLVQASLDPLFLLIPILALVPLLTRRIRPEVLWLALAALIAAFMAKTDNPPLGILYDWMYLHIPGWHLFREGSKFLYIVSVAYSVLVPLSLSIVWTKATTVSLTQVLRRVFVFSALGLAAGLSIANLVPLMKGDLGSTTTPTPEPGSFAAVSNLLAQDQRPGPVLWIGFPILNLDQNHHHYVIASTNHPLVNLSGIAHVPASQITHLDPLQSFCPDDHLPYCYLEPDLFRYLTRTAGVGYVVLPGGANVGVLPAGVSRTWLRERMTAIFGPPQVFGGGAESLLLWRMNGPRPTVVTAPAVAVVDGGPWSTRSVLPALQALALPTTYSQSFNVLDSPPAGPQTPRSIAVVPRVDNGCFASSARSVGVMAKTSQSAIQVDVAGRSTTLPLLARPGRLPEWGVYGTVATPSGVTRIESASVTLGPCLGWSSLTAGALEARPDPALPVSVSSRGVNIIARVGGQPAPAWIELKRAYDPGWRLGGSTPTLVGDNLFNLYNVAGKPAFAKQGGGNVVFAFSTAPWEQRGQLITGLGVALALGIAIWSLRRRRASLAAEDEIWLESRWAPAMAAIGMILLLCALAASVAARLGLPSIFTSQAFANDPYGLEVGYGGVAITLIALSAVLRLGEHLFRRRPVKQEGTSISLRASLGFTILALLVASCAGQPQVSTSALLAQAQASGDASSTVGSDLDDARMRRSAKQPGVCIADYTEALRRIPWLVDAYLGRGSCYIGGGGNGPAAVHDYSQAVTRSQQKPDFLLRRAVAYRVSGDTASAASDYQQAAQDPSASAAVYLQAVHGLIALNLLAEAGNVYQGGLNRYPDTALLHLAAADLQGALDHDAQARNEFATAAALATNDADRARLFAHQCHFEVLRLEYQQALVDCGKSVALSTDGSGAYDDMSVAHLGLGRLSDAVTDLDNAIGAFTGSLGPDAQPAGADGFGLGVLYEARGHLQFEARRLGAALTDYESAVSALPLNAPNFRARLKVDIISAQKPGG